MLDLVDTLPATVSENLKAQLSLLKSPQDREGQLLWPSCHARPHRHRRSRRRCTRLVGQSVEVQHCEHTIPHRTAFTSGYSWGTSVNLQCWCGVMNHVGCLQLLPDEVALHVFSHLHWEALITCSLVSRRWRALVNDSSLWRGLCQERNWEWRSYYSSRSGDEPYSTFGDSDDEGMGDDEEDEAVEHMLLDDSGFASMTMECTQASTSNSRMVRAWLTQVRHSIRSRPPIPAPFRVQPFPPRPIRPDYKLLFATHIRLRNRFLSSSYSLSTLQTRGAPNGHSNTIYCLQLYTYPETGLQVLFTGSKDRTIREWDISTGTVRRVIQGFHEGSVLSICAYNGLLASGGSDRQVVVWDLVTGSPIRIIRDHDDSVLCVRFNDKRLVSCSKGDSG